MKETIKLDVDLRAFVRRETRGRWVAVCPVLGVASQGVTADDAKRSLQEAVEAWFESCVERGVLDQALREASFRAGTPGEPVPVGMEHVTVHRDWSDDDDVLGDDFPIHLTIPAYQAAVLLTPA